MATMTSYNGDFSDGMTDQDETLAQMQMEALGLGRREYISTHDFEENMTGLISARALNATRLVNKAGTKESRQTEDQKSDLSKWNNAWRSLQGDGTLEEGLDDLNAGQTHRLRLVEDPNVKYYDSRMDFSHARRGGRGPSQRGGRGGGRIAGQPGRLGPRRIPTGAAPPQPSTHNHIIQESPRPKKNPFQNLQDSRSYTPAHGRTARRKAVSAITSPTQPKFGSKTGVLPDAYQFLGMEKIIASSNLPPTPRLNRTYKGPLVPLADPSAFMALVMRPQPPPRSSNIEDGKNRKDTVATVDISKPQEVELKPIISVVKPTVSPQSIVFSPEIDLAPKATYVQRWTLVDYPDSEEDEPLHAHDLEGLELGAKASTENVATYATSLATEHEPKPATDGSEQLSSFLASFRGVLNAEQFAQLKAIQSQLAAAKTPRLGAEPEHLSPKVEGPSSDIMDTSEPEHLSPKVDGHYSDQMDTSEPDNLSPKVDGHSSDKMDTSEPRALSSPPILVDEDYHRPKPEEPLATMDFKAPNHGPIVNLAEELGLEGDGRFLSDNKSHKPNAPTRAANSGSVSAQVSPATESHTNFMAEESLFNIMKTQANEVIMPAPSTATRENTPTNAAAGKENPVLVAYPKGMVEKAAGNLTARLAKQPVEWRHHQRLQPSTSKPILNIIGSHIQKDRYRKLANVANFSGAEVTSSGNPRDAEPPVRDFGLTRHDGGHTAQMATSTAVKGRKPHAELYAAVNPFDKPHSREISVADSGSVKLRTIAESEHRSEQLRGSGAFDRPNDGLQIPDWLPDVPSTRLGPRKDTPVAGDTKSTQPSPKFSQNAVQITHLSVNRTEKPEIPNPSALDRQSPVTPTQSKLNQSGFIKLHEQGSAVKSTVPRESVTRPVKDPALTCRAENTVPNFTPSASKQTSGSTTTPAPKGVSMLNQTGLIGQLERVKKAKDPLEMARKRGF